MKYQIGDLLRYTNTTWPAGLVVAILEPGRGYVVLCAGSIQNWDALVVDLCYERIA